MEIESLFKALNVSNLNDIPILQIGILNSVQIQQFNSISQEIEISYMQSKMPLIPIRQRAPLPAKSGRDGGDMSYNIDS